MTTEYITNDPSMTLYAWQMFITDLVAKHGPNAVLSTDGGANNVSLVLESMIKEREKSSYPVIW